MFKSQCDNSGEVNTVVQLTERLEVQWKISCIHRIELLRVIVRG